MVEYDGNAPPIDSVCERLRNWIAAYREQFTIHAIIDTTLSEVDGYSTLGVIDGHA